MKSDVDSMLSCFTFDVCNEFIASRTLEGSNVLKHNWAEKMNSRQSTCLIFIQ